MNNTQLSVMMRAFNVERYHLVPTARRQTVGDHTARVIALLFYFTDGKPSLQLVQAALEHDALEGLTGDIPATAKWDVTFGKAVKELEKSFNHEIGFKAEEGLTPEEMQLLKMADIVELCVWSSCEVAMGNNFMQECFFNGTTYLSNMDLPEELKLKIDKVLGPRTKK